MDRGTVPDHRHQCNTTALSIDGSPISDTFAPDGDPVEFETGGDVTTSVIFLHGITCPSQIYVEGDGDQQFGRNFEKSEFWSLKQLLADSPGVRVVLPQSPPSNSKAILGKPPFSMMGVTSIISWVHQNGYPPAACYDFSRGRAKGVISYIQGLIDKEIERGVKPERVFVAGHSQGACCGGFATLTYGKAPLGGLIMLATANHCIARPTGLPTKAMTSYTTLKRTGHSRFCAATAADRAWKYENGKVYESLRSAVGDDGTRLWNCPMGRPTWVGTPPLPDLVQSDCGVFGGVRWKGWVGVPGSSWPER